MKLGVLVSHLGPTQLNYYLIRNANAALQSGGVADVVAFYENMTRPCLPLNFAAMQVAEGWGFDGVAVATTLSTAGKLLSFPSARVRAFYVWDLEWLRMDRKAYRPLAAVYGSPQLTLLARSEAHADAIEDAWNRRPTVVDDFDFTQLLEAVI